MNILHTIYDIESGEILQSGWGEPFIRPGTDWIAGEYDGRECYVKDGAARPRPPRPQPWMTWDLENEVWIDPRTNDDHEAEALAIRSATFVTRIAFCDKALELNILSPNEAKQAAKGEIPSSYIPVLAGMTNEEVDRAEINWAGASMIGRMDPFILRVAELAQFSPELVDELFGVELP